MIVFKTAEQRQQYEPSFQVDFKSSLSATIIIMLVDSVQDEELVLIASSKLVLPHRVVLLSLRGVVLFLFKSLLLKTATLCLYPAA